MLTSHEETVARWPLGFFIQFQHSSLDLRVGFTLVEGVFSLSLDVSDKYCSYSLFLSFVSAVRMHIDLTLLHSCTFVSLVTELLCALDHSSKSKTIG